MTRLSVSSWSESISGKAVLVTLLFPYESLNAFPSQIKDTSLGFDLDPNCLEDHTSKRISINLFLLSLFFRNSFQSTGFFVFGPPMSNLFDVPRRILSMVFTERALYMSVLKINKYVKEFNIFSQPNSVSYITDSSLEILNVLPA